MKKLFIFIIAIFCFLLILLLSLFLHSEPTKNGEEKVYTDYSKLILDNSSWLNLSKSDFNSLLLETYSENILAIINSLENSTPVIIEVNGGKFSVENKNNFIVASSFDDTGKVFIYLPSGNNYTKATSSLEELLENAVRIFVINDEGVLK